MNSTTQDSLNGMLRYWEKLLGESPFAEQEVEICRRLLKSHVPLTDEELEAYFDRLQGPEGCDFKNGSWKCKGGNDKTKSAEILENIGCNDEEIALMHDYVDVFGGHCDCEIVFNAMDRMLP